MAGPVISSDDKLIHYDYWDKKFDSIEEFLPQLSIAEDEKKKIQSEVDGAQHYLAQMAPSNELNRSQIQYLHTARIKIVEAMRRGSLEKMREANRHNKRMEVIGKTGEIVSYVGMGVAIGIATAGVGSAVTAAVMTDGALAAGAVGSTAAITTGVSTGTAAIVGTSVATGMGAGLGAFSGAARTVGESYWLNQKATAEQWKKNIIMGTVEGTMAAFGPSAGRAIYQTVAAKEVLTSAKRIGLVIGQNVIDGTLSGSAIETTRSITQQIYDEQASWDQIDWERVASSGAIGAGIGALGGLILPAVIRGGSRMVNAAGGKIRSKPIAGASADPPVTDPMQNPLEAGKKAMSAYLPDPQRTRPVPGNHRVVPAEGVRPIPKAVMEDPPFKTIHNGDPHKRLVPHRVVEALNYFGLRLYKKNVSVGDLDPSSPDYAAALQSRLRDDLDDDTIKGILRFFGVNCHTDNAWAQQIQWAKAGWADGKKIAEGNGVRRIIMDADDTVVDGWNPHWADLPFPLSANSPVTWIKAPIALLHLVSPINLGGMNYVVQARPATYEIFQVLRTGKTIPVKTDGFRRMLSKVYALFPTRRFAHTGKLPYQKVNYVDDIARNRLLRTADEQALGMEKLSEELESLRWEGLPPPLKEAIAVAVFHSKGYKMKLRELDRLTDPDLDDVYDANLVDNASYYSQFWSHTGGRSIWIPDRHMSLFGGHYASGDWLGGLNLLFRNFGFQRLADLTNRVGRLNNLPRSKYGATDQMLTALDDLEKNGKNRIAFNTPPPADTLKRLVQLFYRPMPNTGLASGNEVQRGTVYLPWGVKTYYFDALREQSKSIVDRIKARLLNEVDQDGVSAYEKASKLFKNVSTREMQEINYGDLPRPPIPRDSPPDDPTAG